MVLRGDARLRRQYRYHGLATSTIVACRGSTSTYGVRDGGGGKVVCATGSTWPFCPWRDTYGSEQMACELNTWIGTCLSPQFLQLQPREQPDVSYVR